MATLMQSPLLNNLFFLFKLFIHFGIYLATDGLESPCCWCDSKMKHSSTNERIWLQHDDVNKWKHFPRYWTFVRGLHRSPVNSPHKGQWRRALMFSLICARINGWVNNGEAGESRRYRPHYDVTVMKRCSWCNVLSFYFLETGIH